MVEFCCDTYKIAVRIGKEPDIFDSWLAHASFKDIDGLKDDGTPIYIGVRQGEERYNTVIALRSDPIAYGGFTPGFLIVPETATLFVGVGKLVMTYDLKRPQRKFEKELSCGFWGWTRHKNLIVMQEELEFGMYSIDGYEKWSTFVEPPWTFDIEDDLVKLNVMDKISYRDLKTGKLIN